MSFDVSADAYLRFMGRFSEPLGERFIEQARLPPAGRVLDVGCGPGALTARLVALYGLSSVAAIDPSHSFVEAVRERIPGVDACEGVAEALPYDDDSFDASLAQLVVHFMTDPVAGLREMGRVTRPGGVVTACGWDHSGGGSPLSLFWDVAQSLDPAAPHEAALPGASEGHLAEIAEAAGLTDIESSALRVSARFSSYDEWWAPYLLGVGPLGAYVASLDDERRQRQYERCIERLPDPPFEQEAVAWNVRAIA